MAIGYPKLPPIIGIGTENYINTVVNADADAVDYAEPHPDSNTNDSPWV